MIATRAAMRTLVLLAGCGAACGVAAQAFPVKPMRLVTAFPAGGPSDLFGRVIAQKLTELLGQQVVIDARPGANGLIAAENVVKSPPDGHTFLLGSATVYLTPIFYRTMPFNLLTDLAPVTVAVRVPDLLVVHPSVPAQTIKEFIAFAKARKGQVTFASGGNFPRLIYESFRTAAGIDTLTVPYKGAAPAITELIGGQVHMTVLDVPVLLPHVKDGRLRALAASSRARVPALPDVPTMAEIGYPGAIADNWYAIALPGATPKEVVAKLHGALRTLLTSADTRARFATQNAQVTANTPEEFGAFMRQELERWTKVARAAGIPQE